MMIDETKLRRLLNLIKTPLEAVERDNRLNKESVYYGYTIEALKLREELIQELGLLEDKTPKGKLKQIKLDL